MKYQIGTKVKFGLEPSYTFEIIGNKNVPYIMKMGELNPKMRVDCPDYADYILRPLQMKKQFESFRFAPEWDLIVLI
jgi:hypothetical protein